MAEIITNNPRETQELAGKFINDLIKAGKRENNALVVALEGELGSGKTSFVQGAAAALGIKEHATSPTFTLIKNYQLPIANNQLKNFYHIDCYRIDKPWQLQELGFEEIINNPQNIVVIEWAEKIPEILPKAAIKIKFEFVDENKRKIIY